MYLHSTKYLTRKKGLHEDLNRITRGPCAKKKPYTEQRDSDGRPDVLVADEWWRSFLKRDLSIITQLFYGQFKSLTTCR